MLRSDSQTPATDVSAQILPKGEKKSLEKHTVLVYPGVKIRLRSVIEDLAALNLSNLSS